MDTEKVLSERREPSESERRKLLEGLGIALGTLVGAIVVWPGIAFVLGPVLQIPRNIWRPVGKIDSFQVGTTVKVAFPDVSPRAWSGVTARTAAWLHREAENVFEAFSINCTHLGCPVRWLPDADLFMCPCHGGVYYKDGKVAAGPPPRPLVKYPVRLRNGQVEIRTSPLPIST
jgi:menaquinol-cytochrome c reductase iron-sulfur subunit